MISSYSNYFASLHPSRHSIAQRVNRGECILSPGDMLSKDITKALSKENKRSIQSDKNNINNAFIINMHIFKVWIEKYKKRKQTSIWKEYKRGQNNI